VPHECSRAAKRVASAAGSRTDRLHVTIPPMTLAFATAAHAVR
jgi:hypothetical protein